MDRSKLRFQPKDLAATALLQLKYLSRNIEIAIADPRLAEMLIKGNKGGLQRIVNDLCSAQGFGFMTCYIINREGIMIVHAPRADHVIGTDLSWRDHFQGAKEKSGAVHVSRVYRGYSDNIYKFAISAAILDRQNGFLGTIATSVTTDASLGPVISHDDNRKVALIAPTDINSPEEPRSDRYVILYHPGYRKGIDPVEFPYIDKLGVTPEAVNELKFQLTENPKPLIWQDDNYRDPVSSVVKEYAGRWIAGFAPVVNTGFFVVVQQRFEDAVSLELSTLWRLALGSVLASLVAICYRRNGSAALDK